MRQFLSLFMTLLFLGQSFSARGSSPEIPESQEMNCKNEDAAQKNKDCPPPQPKVEQEMADSRGLWTALDFGSTGSSDELALIIMAVIGVTMVVAWVPYFPLLAYKAIKGEEGQQLDQQLSLVSSVQFDGQRRGHLSGARYSFYLSNQHHQGLGMATELGYYNYSDKDEATGSRRGNDGPYWLIGPSLLFRFDPVFYSKLDLMGGTSVDSDLGLISRAEASLNANLGRNISAGLGIGGIYLKMKEYQGVFSNQNELGLIFSANLTASF